jgi:hypothetical protein
MAPQALDPSLPLAAAYNKAMPSLPRQENSLLLQEEDQTIR